MAATSPLLSAFNTGWKTYQDLLIPSLAPLTPEQLTMRSAPNLRTLGEIATHLVAARARWFSSTLNEGDAEIAEIGVWDREGQPARSAAELIHGLEVTWALMQDALARWSDVDLAEPFTRVRYGESHTLTRAWIIWHLLEHDLHHGGEISFLLGQHGLTAPDL